MGTNNIVSDSSNLILKKIKSLISHIIKVNNAEYRIIISQTVRRTDNGKSTFTLNNLHKLLAEFNFRKIDNSNIGVSCLGKHRFHLNNRGTGEPALKIINFLKVFVTLILQVNHLERFTNLSALAFEGPTAIH